MATTATVKMTRADLGDIGLAKVQIRKMIGEGMKVWSPIYREYMNVVTTDDAYFEDFDLSGGFGNIPKKDEGDLINFVMPVSGNRTRYVPEMYQAAFAITFEDRRHNRINKVEKYSRMLREAGESTIEQIAALPLNLGFSSTFHGSDNVPLFSTAHTAANGDTVSNRPAVEVDLTMASLEAGITAFTTQRNGAGRPVRARPQFLVVHPSNELNARRLLGANSYFTGGVPGAADTGVPNLVKGMGITLIVNPWLTDEDAWFLLGGKNQHELNMVFGLMPKDRTFEDEYTMDYVYSWFFMATSGFSSYLYTYGTTGAA